MANQFTDAQNILPTKVWRTFPFLAGSFTLISFIAAIWAMGYQESTSHVQTLSDGLSTCFTRVNQSFTARMIGEKSSEYLRNTFFQSTEDCFGEVISYNQQNLRSRRDKSVGIGLNQLSAEVHLFHELIKPTVGFQNKDAGLIPDRYSKLETYKANVDDAMGTTKNRLNKYMMRLRKVFGAGAFIVGTLSILLLMRLFNKSKNLRELEIDAREQLGDGHYANADKIKGTILEALTLFDFDYVLRLAQGFFNQSSNSQFERPKTSNKSLGEDLIVRQQVAFATEWNNQLQMEKIWENSERELTLEASPATRSFDELVEDEKNIAGENSLSEVLAKAIDQYSAKLFSNGILVHLDTDDIQTNVSHEVLEQVVFGLFSEVLDAVNPENSNSLNITLKKDNDRINFSILRCSTGWTPNAQDSTQIRIIKGLLAECQGDVSIQDAKDSEGQLIGRTYAVSIPISLQHAGLQNKKRVSAIVKGKKREILASM